MPLWSLALTLLPVLALGCPPAAPPVRAARAASDAGVAAAAPWARAGKPVLGIPRAPVPLAKYFDIRRVRNASFSHDEKLVAYLYDGGGRLDVWVQPVAGGPATQLTHVQGVIHSFAFSPVEDRLLFEVDDGGNDEPRLYLTDSRGSAPMELLPHPPKGSRIGFVQWANDGRSLLYITNLPGQDFTEIHELDLATRRSETLWKSPPNLSFSLASRDGRRLVLLETLSDADSNLYLFERGGREAVLLTPHQREVQHTPADFSQDGETLFYTSTGAGDFTALYAMDLRTRKSRLVRAERWDVEGCQLSRGGRYLASTVNADGTPEVELREARTGRTVPLPRPVQGGALVPVAFSGSDRYLAANLVTDTAPEALHLIDLVTGTTRPLHEVLPTALAGRRMVAGESVRIPSFDGREVPALVYSPPGEGPFPAVIDVHGGPNAQARRQFSGLRQYLISKGYVVLAPNVRGSTGYGRTYTALDNLDLGGGPLRDLVACKKWLAAHRRVDPARVAVMGASYGGYMALAAATFTPTEFAAHVDHFGISDLKSLVESYPAYWATFARAAHRKYGDPKNPEHARYQYERSPIHHVDHVERPLLVVQGENDARVRRDQSDRLVAALRAKGIPVHYLLIPGEGHGFSKNANRLLAYEATDRFLDRYLLGDATAEVLPAEAAPSSAAAEKGTRP